MGTPMVDFPMVILMEGGVMGTPMEAGVMGTPTRASLTGIHTAEDLRETAVKGRALLTATVMVPLLRMDMPIITLTWKVKTSWIVFFLYCFF